MTIEERFERIEHVIAGIDDERRKDREENRQLWRGTQRQIGELSVRLSELTFKIADTNDAIARFAEESRVADQQLRERIDAGAEESRRADQRLGERIGALVSAMGKFLAK